MLKSVLIGLDGTPYSAAATELGIDWAKRYGCALIGLGIIDEPTIRQAEPVPVGGMHFDQVAEDVKLSDAYKKVGEFLGDFLSRCSNAGVPARTLEDTGLPYEEILLEAQRSDIVLLGKRTSFHFETEATDHDTLKKVLKATPRPVVVVPEKIVGGADVVMAYDGSLQSARVLQVFYESGLHEGRKIYVTSVAESAEKAKEKIFRAVEYLKIHGADVEPNPIVSTAPIADVILGALKSTNAGLLVMGAYGHSTLREFVVGSVTRTLLEKSPLPIFLFH